MDFLSSVPVLGASPDISHYLCTIRKVERGFVSFCGDVLARGVGRREQELGLFRCCGCSELFDLSVGLGTIPRLLRAVMAVSGGRAARARGGVETAGGTPPQRPPDSSKPWQI